MNKKGQISLSQAPTVVMIVGFIFLIMATIAFVSEKYQDAFPTGNTVTVVNETLENVNDTLIYVSKYSLCNSNTVFGTFTNNSATADVIDSGNFTVSQAAGSIKVAVGGYNATLSIFNVTYTTSFSGTSCNVTTALNSELSSNTSIAGIVLTISLIGIVLSVLIGVFITSRRSGL